MPFGASLESTSRNHDHYRVQKPIYNNGRMLIVVKKCARHCPYQKEKNKLGSKENRKLKALSSKRNGHDKRRLDL
jgi:Pyruvate/2-oxoacid:ferredoxin oxidoreductase delta subunit